MGLQYGSKIVEKTSFLISRSFQTGRLINTRLAHIPLDEPKPTTSNFEETKLTKST